MINRILERLARAQTKAPACPRRLVFREMAQEQLDCVAGGGAQEVVGCVGGTVVGAATGALQGGWGGAALGAGKGFLTTPDCYNMGNDGSPPQGDPNERGGPNHDGTIPDDMPHQSNDYSGNYQNDYSAQDQATADMLQDIQQDQTGD